MTFSFLERICANIPYATEILHCSKLGDCTVLCMHMQNCTIYRRDNLSGLVISEVQLPQGIISKVQKQQSFHALDFELMIVKRNFTQLTIRSVHEFLHH